MRRRNRSRKGEGSGLDQSVPATTSSDWTCRTSSATKNGLPADSRTIASTRPRGPERGRPRPARRLPAHGSRRGRAGRPTTREHRATTPAPTLFPSPASFRPSECEAWSMRRSHSGTGWSSDPRCDRPRGTGGRERRGVGAARRSRRRYRHRPIGGRRWPGSAASGRPAGPAAHAGPRRRGGAVPGDPGLSKTRRGALGAGFNLPQAGEDPRQRGHVPRQDGRDFGFRQVPQMPSERVDQAVEGLVGDRLSLVAAAGQDDGVAPSIRSSRKLSSNAVLPAPEGPWR